MQAINIPDRKSSILTRLNLALERRLLHKYSIVVGADEAGRGPLAGPVVAAGVSLPSRMESDSSLTPLLNIIRDSKLLSENEREGAYAMMVKIPGLLYAVEIRDNRQIDEMNILQASLDAMGCAALRVADAAACAIVRRRSSGSPPQTTARHRRPGLRLKTKILFDGNAVPRAMRSSFEHVVDEAPSAEFRKPSSSTGGAAAILSIDAEAIVKGDAKVASIAAASIFAKVTRDRLMMELHRQYPLYGFSTHKGYPTAQHLAALKRYGPCSVHRASFQPLRRLIENGELPYPFEGKSASSNSDNAISVAVASPATHEMRTRIHTQSPHQRQVTGHKPKTDAFSDSSPSTRSTQQSSESSFLGEFNQNIHVGTRAYMGSREKETLTQMAFLNASSRPVNRRRTEASPVSQNRRIMTKVSMKSGLRASPKNTTGKSVSKPQSRTTRNKSRGATTPKRLLMSGAKKETSTEVCDMPRKLSRKNKKEQTSRNRDTAARKLQRRRIRTGHHAEPLQKDIRTQPKSGTHTSRGSRNNVQKEEGRIETARAKGDSVQSGNSRGISTSPVRLRRRNAIINAEEASKEARAAAARVRAAQQKSRGVEGKQVLKHKAKQRRSPNKRSSPRKRGVGQTPLQ